MSFGAVLLPLFVQVALTFVLLFSMGTLRTGALRSGTVAERDIALRQPAWPARATQVANAFHNQLELPTLFYVLTILAWMARAADLTFVVMAWVFVLLRVVHAAVHVSGNNLRLRGGVFALSALVLVAMWIIFMVRILVASP